MKNKLEKFDFNMVELKLFDSFAGKGALHKALKKLGIPIKVIGLSEIEPDAIIAYAGVHIKDFINLDFHYPSESEMRNELMNINVGWDFTKQKSSIPRMKKEKLKLLYKANRLTNNFGDISILNYPILPDFDLFNFSFPCTDISNAGKQKGLKNEDGTHTRSGQKFNLERGLHPTQKPVDLFSYLIKTHCPQNGLVVDICCGSGTTAVASIKTNRKFIANDSEYKYYIITKERIKNTYKEIK